MSRLPAVLGSLAIVYCCWSWAGGLGLAQGQEKPPVHERELFVPFEDLDLILENDPNRVYLTRAEYEQLVKDAKQSPRLAKPQDVALLAARYQGTIVDGRVQITGTLTYDVLADEGIFLVPIPWAGLGLQSADLDGTAAPMARAEDGTAQLVLSGTGEHELVLQMTAAAQLDAAQQSLQFLLPTQTVTQFSLAVNGNVDIKSGAAVITREYREAADTTEFELLPPPGNVNLVLSVNNRQRQSEQVISAQSVLVSEVTQGYERLYATISYRVLQGATDSLLLEIPSGFDVTQVETTLLSRWEQLANDEGQPQLKVMLRESATERIVLQITANRSPSPDEDWLESLAKWQFPRVVPLDTQSQVSVLGLLLEDRLQSRMFTAADLLPLDSSVLTRAIPESVLKAEPGAPAIRQVAAYYAPQTEFDLNAEVFRPEVELRVASSLILLVADQGLELSGTFVVSPFAEELYDLNLWVPTAWQIEKFVDSQGNPLAFERRSGDEERVRYSIRLPQGISPGSKASFDFLMSTTPDGWLQEWSTQPLEFPQVSLAGATEVGGALAVQTQNDLKVTPGDFANLIPILETEKAELGIANIPSALAYRFDNADYALPLTVERTEPILTARCLSFLKIEPGNLSAHYELKYDVRRARVRTVQFSLPLDSPVELQVRTYPENRVSEVLREDGETMRVWSVKLQEPQIGDLTVVVDYQQPLEEADSASLALPLVQAEGVTLQSGLFSVEGDPELEISVASEARRVDVGELTTDTYAIGRRLVGSFGFVGAAIPATAQIATRVAYGLPPAIAQRAELVSRVSVSGKTQSVARYDLLSKASLLEVYLPAESTLWTIFLDGEPTKPQRDGDRLLLGLPSQSQMTLRRLQIVYETPTSPLGLTGRVDLAAPRLAVRNLDEDQPYEIPQADLKWEVLLPAGHRIQWSGGTLTAPPVEQRPWAVAKFAGFVAGVLGGRNGVLSVMTPEAMSAQLASREFAEDAAAYDEAPSGAFDPFGGEATKEGSDMFGVAGAFENEQAFPPTRDEASGQPPGADSSVPQLATIEPEPQATATQPADPQAAAVLDDKTETTDSPAQTPASGKWALEGVSSLRIDLEGSSDSSTVFRSLGEAPQLTLSTVNGHSLSAAAWAVGLLAVLFGIGLWRKSWVARVRWVVLLLIVGMVPLIVTTRLDGVAIFFDSLFFAGCALIPLYLILSTVAWGWQGLCFLACKCCRRDPSESPTSVITSCLLGGTLLIALSNSGVAQEPPGNIVDLSGLEALLKQLEGPVAIPENAIIVPYDPEVTPTRTPEQKLLVPYAEYARLWNLAHPEQPLEASEVPLRVAVAQARYAALLGGERSLTIRGSIEIISYVEEPQVVPLALSGAVVVSATLDEAPARMQFVPSPAVPNQEPQMQQQMAGPIGGNPNRQLLLLVQGKGRHVLELELQLALERQGAWQVVDAMLPVATAQTLELTIPQPQTEVSQQGLIDISNRESTEAGEVWKTTLGPAGQLGLRWRTKLSQAQVDQSLTAKSQAVFDIREDTLRIAWNVNLEFGRSTRDTFSFDAPGDYVVEQVMGANVRGFTSRPEADRQQIDVTLLKPVQGSTQLTLVLTRRGGEFSDSSQELDVPVIQVRDAALESGEVLIRRSPRLDAQVVLSDGISRYDENESLLALAQSADADEAAILAPLAFQAFRFVKPPFVLRLKIQPLPSEPTVSIRSALRVSEREVTLDSAIRVQPQGQPIYQLSVRIPGNLEPIRVGGGDQEWSLVADGDRQLLSIRYLDGQTQPFEMPILFRLNDPFVVQGDGTNSLEMPNLSVDGAKSQSGQIVIVPDPDTDVRLDNLSSCQAAPLTRGPGWLVAEQQQLAKAVLRYSVPNYSATLNLIPRVPQVSSRSVTNVLITSRSIEETVLIDFTIEQAGIRELSLLVPDVLAQGQLSAKLLKQKTLAPATDDNGQPIAGWQRMTLQLQDDVRGAYSLLLEGDRLLSGASHVVQLPVVETGRSLRRLVAVENAGRDEIVVDPDQVVGLESLSPQQQAWKELTQVLGNSLSQAFIATDEGRLPQLVFEAVERQQVERAGARIGLAQTTLIVDESGGYRAFVEFRVSNADEPFLELELPAGANLWTVSVAGEPGKAIQAQAGNAGRVRIPLVKTAEGEGDYPVQIKYAGKMDLRSWAQPVSFPLIKSSNINIELSQVRLLLPDTIDWLDFNGTMRLVEDEGELAKGFQSYLNKRIQDATQALSSGSNPYSKVRAAVNLSQSRRLLEDNRREIAGREAADQTEYFDLYTQNAALLQDAEEQAQVELSEVERGAIDNRERLNQAWSAQGIQRAKNLASGLGSNFESSYQTPQPGASQQNYNLNWFAQNYLQTDALDLAKKPQSEAPSPGEGMPEGGTRLRLGDQRLEAGKAKGQSLEEDLKSTNLNRFNAKQLDEIQVQNEIEERQSAQNQAGDESRKLRQYQQQLERYDRDSGEQQASPEVAEANSAGGVPVITGGLGGAVGQAGQPGGGGFGSGGNDFSPSSGPALGVQGPGPGRWENAPAFESGFETVDSGYASLEIELPERGRLYRFTTPRGEMEITARPVAYDLPQRGGRLLQLGALLLGLWLVTRPRLLKLLSAMGRTLVFAIILGLAGLISLLAGPLPVLGLLLLICGLALTVRWFVMRAMRNRSQPPETAVH